MRVVHDFDPDPDPDSDPDSFDGASKSPEFTTQDRYFPQSLPSFRSFPHALLSRPFSDLLLSSKTVP